VSRSLNRSWAYLESRIMCRCGKQALWAFGNLLVWNRGGRAATLTDMRLVFVCVQCMMVGRLVPAPPARWACNLASSKVEAIHE